MAARRQQGKRTLDQRAEEIGARLLGELVEARRVAGWSERQLAREAGVDRTSVVQLEAGVGTVATLVAVLGPLRFQFAEVGQGDTLGEKIANRRVKRNLSVAAVAAKTQLTVAAVESIEEGGGTAADLFLLLALLAPKVRRRAPERVYWGEGDKVDRDSRFTPPEFMAAVYDAFGRVDLDPCAHALSPVVAKRRIMLSEGGDGLSEPWSGRLVYLNPPYSQQLDWLKRAHGEWSAGHVRTVVCLVPVRTDNRFFHETLRRDADLFLLRGRLRFASARGDVQSTPFSLWVATLGATARQKARFAQLVRGCWFRAVGTEQANRLGAHQGVGWRAHAIGRRQLSRFRLAYGSMRRRLRLSRSSG